MLWRKGETPSRHDVNNPAEHVSAQFTSRYRGALNLAYHGAGKATTDKLKKRYCFLKKKRQ
jgi:hypothetical protein